MLFFGALEALAREAAGEGNMRLPSGTVRRRRVLVIDPDAVFRAGLEERLEMALWTVVSCDGADAAAPLLLDLRFDAIWGALSPRSGKVAELLHRARACDPDVEIVVVSGSSNDAEPLPDRSLVFSSRETLEAVRYLADLGMNDAKDLQVPATG